MMRTENASMKLTTKPLTSIQDLRQAGYKVSVIHYRNTPQGEAIVNRRDKVAIVSEGAPYEIPLSSLGNEMGGRTVVRIVTPNVQVVWGHARCNSLDSFTYSMGAKIALGRAISKLIEVTSQKVV